MCALLQAGNFLDKIVTFCVGMGIGEGLPTPLHVTCSCPSSGIPLNIVRYLK